VARAEGTGAAGARTTGATWITPFQGALFQRQHWDEPESLVRPVRVGEIVQSSDRDAPPWPGWLILAAFAGAVALARARRPRQDPAP
jgi:hypothetical protein